MTEDKHHHRPRPGRARQRAIRTHAARAGVPYSVAARQVDFAALRPGETLASYGRTVYSVAWRERRSFADRVDDTRMAAMLPGGRAYHLVERFPPTSRLYRGEGRQDALALLYLVVAHEMPGLPPAVGDLAWIAELGEETALDAACADLDRTARRVLDHDRARLGPRVADAVAAGQASPDWRIRQEAARQLTLDRPPASFDGVRQILDALLIVAEDGHAPGTRVRMLAPPLNRGRVGTIVGAVWGPSGPPIGYDVCLDGTRAVLSVDPENLVVLADQEGWLRHGAEHQV